MARNLDSILIVDVECTCWDKGQAPPGQSREIIEIGICSVKSSTLEIVSSSRLLVKPILSTVSDYCVALTGLTQADVDTGMSFADACLQIETDYSSEEHGWFSYGDFDREIFWHQCGATGVEYPFGRTHTSIKHLAALAYGWPKEVGLARALSLLEMTFEGTPHRGVDDAKNAAKILCGIFKKARI